MAKTLPPYPSAFREVTGIDRRWQAMDGVMTKAPFGGTATG